MAEVTGNATGNSAPSSQQMSEVEALMWTLDADPRLASAMGALVITDVPTDPVLLRHRVQAAIGAMPRLGARVEEPGSPFGPPRWRPDPDLELDFHLWRVALPAPGDHAALLALAQRLIDAPMDRTRPLWQVVSVEGMEGGRGALIVQLHHSLFDGQGALQMATQVLDLDRAGSHRPPEQPPPRSPPRDQPAAAPTAEPNRTRDQDPGGASWAQVLTEAVTVLQRARGPANLARKLAADTLVVAADPTRLAEAGATAGSQLRDALAWLGEDRPRASSLWAQRGRKRVLRTFDLDVSRIRAIATATGSTVNDVFMAGAALAARHAHQRVGLAPSHIMASFVLSTRAEDDDAANAFRPVVVELPVGAQLSATDLVAGVREAVATQRSELSSGRDRLGGLALSAASLLPAGVTRRLALEWVGRLDFATSNLQTSPIPVYLAGGRVEALYPVGPLVGTAFNLTALTYCGQMHCGLHIDPTAVADPDRLVADLLAAYQELHDQLVTPAEPPRPAPADTEAPPRRPRKARAPGNPRAGAGGTSKSATAKSAGSKSTAGKSTAGKSVGKSVPARTGTKPTTRTGTRSAGGAGS